MSTKRKGDGKRVRLSQPELATDGKGRAPSYGHRLQGPETKKNILQNRADAFILMEKQVLQELSEVSM